MARRWFCRASERSGSSTKPRRTMADRFEVACCSRRTRRPTHPPADTSQRHCSIGRSSSDSRFRELLTAPVILLVPSSRV